MKGNYFRERGDLMKRQSVLVMVLAAGLLVSFVPVLAAGDFEWMREFNIRAEADLSGFRARLAARFKMGEAQINAVLGHVEKPAEAYMIFRLGEMCGKPTDFVVEKYRSKKGKGWGELAKSLGIKPGSKEFHALKQGSDLYEDTDQSRGKVKDKRKSKVKN